MCYKGNCVQLSGLDEIEGKWSSTSSFNQGLGLWCLMPLILFTMDKLSQLDEQL
jgi:hypothetical protein